MFKKIACGQDPDPDPHEKKTGTKFQDWIRIHVIGNVESGSVYSGILLKMPSDGKK
jgi:hypothetical protein